MTAACLDRDGYAMVAGVLSPQLIDLLIDAVGSTSESGGKRQKNQRVYAMRNLFDLVPAVKELAQSPAVRNLIEPVLGCGARAVRGLLFDKTPEANWKVAWHQDLSIAVKRKIDVPGFGPWSMKAGVQHVQPPVSVLQHMLTIRLHLDDCGAENGPLVVLPGSHAQGVLSPSEIEQMRKLVLPAQCIAQRGDALVMRPLILHASSSATVPGHRRVIHLEYAAGDLPGGLGWAESIEN